MDEVGGRRNVPGRVPRVLLLPLAFGLAGAAAVLAWGWKVHGSYWQGGVLGLPGVALLGRRIGAEFLACSAAVVLLWGGSRGRRIAVLCAVGFFALVQYAQFRSAVLSNDLLTVGVLRMAEMAEYAVEDGVLAIALACTVSAVGLSSLVAAVSRVDLLNPGSRAFTAAGILAVAVVLAFLPAPRIERSLAKHHGLEAKAPFFEFVRTVALLVRPASPTVVALTEADRTLAREYGIEIRPEEALPIVRPSLYRDPLPFPRRGDVSRPHVVVLFAESLSAGLLDPYVEEPAGITPEIARMASVSMRVDDYFNHAMPTIRGLRGQLCSVFTGFGHEAWRDAPEKLLNAKMRCLPHILGELGYRSVYLSPVPRTEVRVESQFLDFGFDELYFRKEVVDRFLGGEPPGRDSLPTDRQMFRGLVSLMEGWDRDVPLFVALSTVETHTGWDVAAGGVPYGDGGNRVLNSFHNLDAAFGTFWRWFETSAWKDDTIVVLTGDHVLWPHDEARRAAGQTGTFHEVDRMGLLVYDPTHDLPQSFLASTSSIDLAPSLLQLVDAPDSANAFVGWSLFSDRPRFRGGPGQGESRDLLRWEDGRPIVEEVDAESCRDRPASETHACSLLRVITYLQSLEKDNRLWRGE